MERMSDVFKIFEEVQMIFLNIENDTDLRIKMKKTVCILTGFCDKSLGFSNADVTTDRLRIPPTEIVGSRSAASKYERSWM